jgi:ketosteroid isomerase-like protein
MIVPPAGITLSLDLHPSGYLRRHEEHVALARIDQSQEEHMNRRNILSLSVITALGLAFLPGNAVAQQSDIDGVKAAGNAFYVALAALDNGASMEKIWAHTPYVTLAGPRSKSFIVGWDAIKKYWVDGDKLFVERKASLSESNIHVTGNLAWEVGRETGQVKMKDGSTAPVDYLVTRVYEKIDGRWLIVSHHVQPKPQ